MNWKKLKIQGLSLLLAGVLTLGMVPAASAADGTGDTTCDVNGDGEVNIADLILIWNHYSKA